MEQQNFHPEIHYTNVKENREKDEDESFHSLDLVIEEKIIGKAEFVYFSKPFPLYQLSELYVDYEYQGKGLGSELMQQFEAFLHRNVTYSDGIKAVDDHYNTMQVRMKVFSASQEISTTTFGR